MEVPNKTVFILCRYQFTSICLYCECADLHPLVQNDVAFAAVSVLVVIICKTMFWLGSWNVGTMDGN